MSAGFSQVDTHNGFFITLATTDRYLATSPFNTVVSENDFVDVSGTIASGVVLRDCGKFVVTVNAAGYHTAKYRLVSIVNETLVAEGNSGVYYYVKIFDAAGAGVTVARLG